MIPAPHPLDFDWRFDSGTTKALGEMLRYQEPVLALGAPSVARYLESLGQAVTLVDRQPFQDVKTHIVADIFGFVPATGFRAALVDPPWYPETLHHWVAAAAHAVGRGGTILVSIWPNWTRPTATEERDRLLTAFSTWATVRPWDLELSYDIPPFEASACHFSKVVGLSASPRRGDLLELSVHDLPIIPAPHRDSTTWRRFVLDEYQIAFREAPRLTGALRVAPHPQANGWHWPYVSARAPGRELIDVWSSNNEVAMLESPRRAIEAFRRGFLSENAEQFEQQLIELAPLLTWNIPRPPFRRAFEWLHQQ